MRCRARSSMQSRARSTSQPRRRWLVARKSLPASAARARRKDVSSALATEEALAAADQLRPLAERVRDDRAPIRLVSAADDAVHGELARSANVHGPFVALP